MNNLNTQKRPNKYPVIQNSLFIDKKSVIYLKKKRRKSANEEMFPMMTSNLEIILNQTSA